MLEHKYNFKKYFSKIIEDDDSVLDLNEYSMELMCTYITHPDQREGEVFIGNFHDVSMCGWKTKRVSARTFDATGKRIHVGTLAVFAQAQEIINAGVPLKTKKE